MTLDANGSPLLGLNVERILQAERSPAPAQSIADGTHSCSDIAAVASDVNGSACSSQNQNPPASPKVDASDCMVDAALDPVYSAVDRTWPSDDSPASFVKNAAAKVVLEAFAQAQLHMSGSSYFGVLKGYSLPLTIAGKPPKIRVGIAQLRFLSVGSHRTKEEDRHAP